MNLGLKQELYLNKYFTLGTANGKGWCRINSSCPYCKDGSSKNPRSYLKFENDEIGFQCFNCGRKHRFSKSNVNILSHFIEKATYKSSSSILMELTQEKIFAEFKHQTKKEEIVSEDDELTKILTYKEIALPPNSIPYTTKPIDVPSFKRKQFKKYKKFVNTYLYERGLEEHPNIKTLYICTDGEYSGRLIIPIYFEKKLISYAARALFNTHTKYLYPPSDEFHNDRGKIIYGADKLINNKSNQIFGTESILDAWTLNGIAVLSKNITNEQLLILDKANYNNKRIIFILDNDIVDFKSNDLKGITLGTSILKYGNSNWVVSNPNFRNNIKDVTESIVELGMLETYDTIMKSIIKTTDLGADSLLMKAKLSAKKIPKKYYKVDNICENLKDRLKNI